MRRLRPPTLLVALGLLAAAACRVPAERGGGADTGPPAVARTDTPLPAPHVGETAPVAEAEPGAYADDDRFHVLAVGWAERVSAAADRMELATGLHFRDRAPPRIVLAPLGDETKPFTFEVEVHEGRRRAAVRVNAEPLVVRTADADHTLAHALAAAALATRPGGPPAPWVVAWAGLVAAGDTADRVERAARRAAAEGSALRVDPADASAAEATALGVALLLGERTSAVDVRRLLALAADGEDPSLLIARWIQDPAGQWVGQAREILEDAASSTDLSADQAVATAREALTRLGPAGLEQAVMDLNAAGALTEAARLEIESLRLEAALATGDEGAARAALLLAPPEPHVLARMTDPGLHVLRAARAEGMPGGSASRAWTLLSRFERDFPRHPRRGEALDELSGLFGRLPEPVEDAILARVIAARGPGAVEAAAVARRVRALIADHRPGAAARFLDGLGNRADEGDLALLRGEVHLAESEPSPASREANAARVDAWLAAPSPATEAAVADGGAVASAALAARLPGLRVERRAAAVRLLAQAGGIARAVGVLASSWSATPDQLRPDLDVLAGQAGYADLRRSVEALYPAVRDDPRAAAEWERASLGLDPATLEADDTLLARLHSPEFTVRRAAVEQVLATDGAATPAFLERFARDPAILLRRLAVRAAGRERVSPVVRVALGDPSWAVRQAACAAVAESRDADLADAVAALLRAPDPDPRVREGAARALIAVAQEDPAWVRPIVSIVRVGDPSLAEGVASSLGSLPAPDVARAVARELAQEAAAPQMDRAALFRLFAVYTRTTGHNPGYDPSLEVGQVREIVARLPENREPARASRKP
ncbi:MAG TPA: HEAT repeat domain-containing protein [Planctomycetota bacterium]|nr:HEAT repeat domain-containing protein [Planctomycetota bacterium]